MIDTVHTERLLLRRWLPADREPFARMNADPRVMKHFPTVLSREESDAFASRIDNGFEQHGFGLWAVEIPCIAPFIGFVGLAIPRFVTHFTPCVEIGWRIASTFWNSGYATEAAAAVLECGFGTLRLEEIVSFTVPQNIASRRVIEKIGMTRNETDDFDHPSVPDGHPLRRHVLYRIKAISNIRNTLVPSSPLS